MTLYDLRVSLCRKLGYADTPPIEVQDRLTGFLNEVHHRILGLPGMDAIRQSQVTFATVANRPEYSLPPDVSRVLAIRDTVNQIVLKGEPWGWYTTQTPDPASSLGTPEIWVPIGQAGIAVQPANASAIYIKSTAAADVSTCYLEGIRTGGYPFSSSVTMTGVTAVQVGSLTDILAIAKFYLSASASGTVTLTEDTGSGAELARVPIGQTHARYLRVALWPTPSDVITYTVDYLRQVEEMAEHTDEPLVPRDFHWVIEAGARMLEYEKTDDRRYPAARFDYEKGVRDMKWFVTQQADGRSALGAGTVQGSRLGAWYPRGS